MITGTATRQWGEGHGAGGQGTRGQSRGPGAGGQDKGQGARGTGWREVSPAALFTPAMTFYTRDSAGMPPALNKCGFPRNQGIQLPQTPVCCRYILHAHRGFHPRGNLVAL